MTTAGQVTGYWNQTYAVEFTVEGDLDGSTLQPSLLESPPSGDNPEDPQNLFRRRVSALGLVDPDYTVPEDLQGRRGTRGNRMVTYLWVTGSSNGDVGAAIELVDNVDGTPIVQKVLASLEGVTSRLLEGIFVPQGSMIRLTGMSGSAAQPVKVRLHIQELDQDALIELLTPAATPSNGDAAGSTPFWAPDAKFKSPFDPQPDPTYGQFKFETLEASQTFSWKGHNVGANATAAVIADLGPAPTINSFSVTPGTPPDFDVMDIDLDTSGMDQPGRAFIVVTNEAGFSASIQVFIAAGS